MWGKGLKINFLGFTLKGENPAVPLGTTLRFSCPEEWRFEHDWYAPTEVRAICTETGGFKVDGPFLWPKCVPGNCK